MITMPANLSPVEAMRLLTERLAEMTVAPQRKPAPKETPAK
jgi:hypothetical protein